MKLPVKFIVPALAVALMTVGCASKKPATATAENNSLMDIQPAPTPAPSYSQLPPMAPVTPVMVSDSQTSIASSGGVGSISGSNYTIKKGDTLYGIAREKYGDGKQWTKIASANPGVSPSSLRVGQKITLP